MLQILLKETRLNLDYKVKAHTQVFEAAIKKKGNAALKCRILCQNYYRFLIDKCKGSLESQHSTSFGGYVGRKTVTKIEWKETLPRNRNCGFLIKEKTFKWMNSIFLMYCFCIRPVRQSLIDKTHLLLFHQPSPFNDITHEHTGLSHIWTFSIKSDMCECSDPVHQQWPWGYDGSSSNEHLHSTLSNTSNVNKSTIATH